MLRNYLIVALAMLRRKKFLTFVNVFATTLTLTVLIVVAAALSSAMFPRGAEAKSDHYLVVDNVCFTGAREDGGERSWNSGPGFIFFRDYIAPMESPDKVSFASTGSASVAYLEGRKLEYQLRRTDGAYWEILDFDFLEGRPLTTRDLDAGSFVAVVNRATRDSLMGEGTALGEEITANGQTFTIVGVVENEPQSNEVAYADIWVPWTTSPSTGYQDQWLGDGVALLWYADKARKSQVKREFRDQLGTFEYKDPKELDSAFGIAETRVENLANYFSDEYCTSESSVGRFTGGFVGLVLAFMLLPAINMINLNISRILERAPEIGLRKTVGATKQALISQFILENLLLTAAGGLAAFLVVPWVLRLLNRTLVQYGQLSMDWRVFVAGLIFVAIFAILSGAYPAWKMARLEPVQALQGATRNV